MQTYIGTKIIKAMPMTRKAYNAYRGWEVPADENPLDTGYLVEYEDSGRANHPKHKGYISWSPADVFKRSYYLLAGLTFGQAIEAMKAGQKVTRRGWNGKGMFLWLKPAAKIPAEICSDPMLKALVVDNGGTIEALGTICMYTVNAHGRRAVLTGWLASQSDMLSSDWEIYI